MLSPSNLARRGLDLLNDPVSGHLLRGSLVSMIVRVFGLVLAFLSHVLISRAIGAGQYGLYSVALGWALILVIPARLGLDNTVLRYATIYREEERWGELRALVNFCLLMLAGMSVLIAGLLFAGSAIGIGPLEALGPGALLGIAAMIFPLAALGLFSALIRTAKRIFASQFYEQVLRPGLLLLAIGGGAAVGFAFDAATTLLVTVLCTLLALIGIWIHFAMVFRRGRARPDARERGQWLALSWPLLAMSVVHEMLNQIDILLLGYLAGPVAAGHYAAAWRLASLVPFAMVALTAISGPLIASAHRRGDPGELARIARLNARLAFLFACGMALALTVVGRFALGQFGAGFEAGYAALLILLFGALSNAFTGAVVYLITMTGRQKAALPIFAAALAVSLGANLLLIPRYGTAGAAMAATAGMIVWNGLMLVYVRRAFGIDASALALRPRLDRWRADPA